MRGAAREEWRERATDVHSRWLEAGGVVAENMAGDAETEADKLPVERTADAQRSNSEEST